MTTLFFFYEIKFHRKEIKPYPPDMEMLLDIVTKTQNTLRRNFRSTKLPFTHMHICTIKLNIWLKILKNKENEYNFLIL